jgi:hypothetical protein
MDGWMDGWMNGWMDSFIHSFIHIFIHKLFCLCRERHRCLCSRLELGKKKRTGV